jgi:hypothetical protein
MANISLFSLVLDQRNAKVSGTTSAINLPVLLGFSTSVSYINNKKPALLVDFGEYEQIQ